MANRLAIDATSEPILLDEAKAQCRVEHDLDDAEFLRLITAARQYVEGHTRRTMLEATRAITLNCWKRCIKLSYPPLIEVDSITYTDAAGDEQELDEADWRVDWSQEPPVLMPATDWPDLGEGGQIVITYRCGYESAAVVPVKLKQAMLLLVDHWYQHRGAVGTATKEIQFSVTALCESEWLPEYA